MNKTTGCVLFVLVVALVDLFASWSTADIVLMGDTTPLFEVEQGCPGNVTFLNNVIGKENDVVILDTTFSFVDFALESFFDRQKRIQCKRAFELSRNCLGKTSVLFVCHLDREINDVEVQLVCRFLDRGGVLVIAGESIFFDDVRKSNDNIRKFLLELGSEMQLIDADEDQLEQQATGKDISFHPLTNRVNEFEYGATSIVAGGVPLFFTNNGAAFAAFEQRDILRGDVNRDGEVNLLDVDPFLDALINGEFIPQGDVNCDGQLDLLDVADFVDILSG